MFPYVFPALIIVPVLSMFNTSFVTVPAFSLVLPVTTSGPASGAMTKSASPERSMAEGLVQTTPIVIHPSFLANARQPKTYGVRPELAIPMILSSSGFRSNRRMSSSPASPSSSAPSWACLIAASPPAIKPKNCPRGAAKVGGISDASKIPSLSVIAGSAPI